MNMVWACVAFLLTAAPTVYAGKRMMGQGGAPAGLFFLVLSIAWTFFVIFAPTLLLDVPIELSRIAAIAALAGWAIGWVGGSVYFGFLKPR